MAGNISPSLDRSKNDFKNHAAKFYKPVISKKPETEDFNDRISDFIHKTSNNFNCFHFIISNFHTIIETNVRVRNFYVQKYQFLSKPSDPSGYDSSWRPQSLPS